MGSNQNFQLYKDQRTASFMPIEVSFNSIFLL